MSVSSAVRVPTSVFLALGGCLRDCYLNKEIFYRLMENSTSLHLGHLYHVIIAADQSQPHTRLDNARTTSTGAV